MYMMYTNYIYKYILQICFTFGCIFPFPDNTFSEMDRMCSLGLQTRKQKHQLEHFLAHIPVFFLLTQEKTAIHTLLSLGALGVCETICMT